MTYPSERRNVQGIIQPLALLAVVVGAYLLKRRGMFKPLDYRVMQVVVFTFALPGAIVNGFAANEHELSLLWISLFGMLYSLISVLVIFGATTRVPVRRRAFLMLNGSGMNVGNFCLPVISGMLGASAAMPVIMFDIGNSVMMCAGMYVMTVALLHISDTGPIDPRKAGNSPVMPYLKARDPVARRLQRRAHARSILSSFITSIPFDTYALMLILMLCGVRLPAWVAEFTQPIGAANGFCSMMMVGMLTDLPSSRKDVRNVVEVIGWKILFAALLGAAAWFLLPFDPATRKAVVLVCMAPTAVFSTLFTDRVLGNAQLAGFTLASTGVLSLAAMTVANVLIPT